MFEVGSTLATKLQYFGHVSRQPSVDGGEGGYFHHSKNALWFWLRSTGNYHPLFIERCEVNGLYRSNHPFGKAFFFLMFETDGKLRLLVKSMPGDSVAL